MGSARSDIYIKHVLEPTYNFTKDKYLYYFLEINIAHVCMLVKQNIIKQEDGQVLVDELRKLYASGYNKRYNKEFEDLFFMLEADLEKQLGEEIVGDMHIAFSRNDMDAAMFRMYWREQLLDWIDKINKIRISVIEQAKQHINTVMPAHTHNQQAQPTTLAHYLLAVESNLERDCQRADSLYYRVNESPMGAVALSTTGFDIDRDYVSELLGFEKTMENSYDAISASDYMLELASTLANSLTVLSRFVHDLMFMATNEVNILRLDDSVVQTSSVMPQKRNPSGLEHTRAYISKAIGELKGIQELSHNVPLGDIVDIGDDIQEVLDNGVTNAFKVADLLKEIVTKSTFNGEKLKNNSNEGFSTVTEIADYLVRTHHIPFRKSHKIVSSLVDSVNKDKLSLKDESALNTLLEIIHSSSGKRLELTYQEYLEIIDPVNFVQIRDIQGGPSFRQVDSQIKNAEANIRKQEDLIQHHQKGIGDCRAKLIENLEL